MSYDVAGPGQRRPDRCKTRRDRRPAPGVPSWPGALLPGQVMQVTLTPGEWMLVIPPGGSGPASVAALARELASRHRPAGAPVAGLVIRLPGASISPGLGPAVLHATHGKVAVYCPASQITAGAADWLSALADHSGLALPPSRRARPRQVTVTPVCHSGLPGGLHPAAAFTTEQRVGIVICENLLTTAVSDAIGQLLTAQAACAGG